MLDQSGNNIMTVGCRLKSGIWQIVRVNCPKDIHGASRLPLEIPITAYDVPRAPRSTHVKFLKGNKNGKWFYEEV